MELEQQVSKDDLAMPNYNGQIKDTVVRDPFSGISNKLSLVTRAWCWKILIFILVYAISKQP